MKYVANCAIGGCGGDNSYLVILIVFGVIIILVAAYFIYNAISKEKKQ